MVCALKMDGYANYCVCGGEWESSVKSNMPQADWLISRDEFPAVVMPCIYIEKPQVYCIIKCYLFFHFFPPQFICWSRQLQVLMVPRSKRKMIRLKKIKKKKKKSRETFARLRDSPFHQSNVLHTFFLLSYKLLQSTWNRSTRKRKSYHMRKTPQGEELWSKGITFPRQVVTEFLICVKGPLKEPHPVQYSF